MADARRLRVLVVEDEALVAMLIEDMLLELGYEVLGPAMRLGPALEMARDEIFDLAVLDVNLANEQSFPVAQLLQERGIPFVFATGYGLRGAGRALPGSHDASKALRIASTRGRNFSRASLGIGD
ncbi:response regulator [Mesorhizobium loti]|nr:response regulator [Mesorhizobium loti]